MSLIVEVAGMFSGMLAEYISSKKWGKLKAFFVASGGIFTLFSIYVIIVPSDKSVFLSILFGILLSVALGLFFIGVMYLREKYKK